MAAGFETSRRLFDICSRELDEVGESAIECEDAAGENATGRCAAISTWTGIRPADIPLRAFRRRPWHR